MNGGVHNIVRKFDFVIEEDSDRRIVFRFYPRRSSVHSFNDEPPKTWDEVYKVYFCYAIICQYKNENGAVWRTEILYEEDFDECSCISEVAYAARQIANGKNDKLKYEMFPHGYGTEYALDGSKSDSWEIRMFNQPSGKGYRFWLEPDRMNEFADVINRFLEHALEHGESI